MTSPTPLTLTALVESILYAAGEPAAVSAIAAALDASAQDIELALDDLATGYAERGVRVQRLGNRVQLVTAPESAERVQRFLGLESQNRLSTAALETLAIIAYRQPVTKPQIEMLRGVNCDGVMATLEARNLIQELGKAESVGHPMRYGVSFEFLQYFGLKGTHDLPTVENLETLPSLEGAPAPPGAPRDADAPEQALLPLGAEAETPSALPTDAGPEASGSDPGTVATP
ncbi:MAG: SMC-Scp complex subunit ScpB [Thermoflexales bacterium]|nr:SMC-Scp complex subunit ScpB [Thermoflexales bacterium]